MANLGTTFKAEEVPERQDFSPVPPGKYVGMIVKSDMKENSAKTGSYLELEIDILENPGVKGRKVFERLNLLNTNSTAQEIAQQTLAEICKAVGVLNVSDSNQLHDKRFLMDVVVEEGKPYMNKLGQTVEGKPQNKVKRYYPYSALQPVTQQSGATEASSNKPWKK